jgi:hypothetical protein
LVSSQRLGGYAVWAKRRLEPDDHRFTAVVLLADAEAPNLHLVPTVEWRDATAPLVDRDNVGKRSEAEYGIRLTRASLPALARYEWNVDASKRYLG